MRKMLVVLGMFAVEQVIAQNYVHIPDSVFASYLETTIPDAMYGDSLDITSLLVTIETDTIDISGLPISNIEGIQYFSSLKYINSYYCAITAIPSLPSSLRYLECGRNLLEELPTLPDSLTHLFCGGNLIAELPVLPHTLFYLSCGSNLLTNLPPLPNSLRALSCPGNSLLTQLPVLPDSLEVLRCMQNSLSTLPVLPNTLTELMCFQNELASLPELPNSLTYLNCASNYLTLLPVLPDSLQNLYCQGNSLTSLPYLPHTLQLLWCGSNNISCFPTFPESILPSVYHSFGGYWQYFLDISGNPFTCVPNYLPDVMVPTLEYPICSDNNPNPLNINIVSGSTSLCSGDTVCLKSPVQSPYYLWSTGANTESICLTTATDDIQVYYMQNGVCNIASNPLSITNSQLPIADFQISQQGLQVQFNNASSFGTSYLWDFGNGLTSTQSSPTYQYQTPGNYFVCLSTSNSCGIDTSCQWLNVIPFSIEENNLANFIIYTNPATTEITITGIAPAYLKLCNTLGQTVAEANKSNKLYVGNLPQGLYVLQMFDEKGLVVKTERVVVGK